MQAPLVLVGGGKMGSAMLDGWLERGMGPGQVYVVEPTEAVRKALVAKGVQAVADGAELAADLAPGVIVLAVKPQVMDQVAPAYARFAAGGAVFLSIAAGKTIRYFEAKLGAGAAIVRAMPNTPAAVRRGITVACGNADISAAKKALSLDLLQAVGEAEWVEDEGLIDAVTALSGGGPAYVFLLAEVMAKAGAANGLPAELAERLVRVTVAGAGELLHQSSEAAATLRQNVTSPGGTTAEALKVLMADDAWQPLMDKAIAAATARSKELAS
ncbi:MAG: pyrroline-5-carboxylate reductase [Rhodospirillaceae bacterium]